PSPQPSHARNGAMTIVTEYDWESDTWSIGKSNGLFHCLLCPPCRPLPATGTPPARQRWPLAQAAPAAWRGTAGVGAAGGLSNAEEGGLRQTRNAKGGV